MISNGLMNTIDIGNELTEHAIIHTNLEQEIIVTTEDKAHRVLQEHLTKVENTQKWITPLGIIMSLIFIPLTTNFKNAFSISAQTWQAVWILATFFVFCWLIISCWKAFQAWRSKCSTIDWVIEKLKNKTRKST